MVPQFMPAPPLSGVIHCISPHWPGQEAGVGGAGEPGGPCVMNLCFMPFSQEVQYCSERSLLFEGEAGGEAQFCLLDNLNIPEKQPFSSSCFPSLWLSSLKNHYCV